MGWHFCDPRDPEAKGIVERLQRYLETSYEPARSYLGNLDYQDQLDRWFRDRANARTHRATGAVPVARLASEREAMRPLPERTPQTAWRRTLRVPPQPFLRFDTNDYSLDPRYAGRRTEVRAGQREIVAVALDTGEVVCRHRRRLEVERRPLECYDRLIPA